MKQMIENKFNILTHSTQCDTNEIQQNIVAKNTKHKTYSYHILIYHMLSWWFVKIHNQILLILQSLSIIGLVSVSFGGIIFFLIEYLHHVLNSVVQMLHAHSRLRIFRFNAKNQILYELHHWFKVQVESQVENLMHFQKQIECFSCGEVRRYLKNKRLIVWKSNTTDTHLRSSNFSQLLYSSEWFHLE